MKIIFFISSIGDTDLALSTIRSLEKDKHEAILFSLTETASGRIASFESSAALEKISLSDILSKGFEPITEGSCTDAQCGMVIDYLLRQKIDSAYFGIPSVNNEIPFQLAKRLKTVPVLMAYEFMFKPEHHCLWQHVHELNKNAHVHWAVPLSDAMEDFDVEPTRLHLMGHLSIDNACRDKSPATKSVAEIRHHLEIEPYQGLAFISSTTQPITTDMTFLESVLAELPNHPNMQVRLGLHPGIQDLDAYLKEILLICQKYTVTRQFRVILPDSFVSRIKHPDVTINNSHLQSLFLRVNITGPDAASAADKVAQAVPGALLNQAALEGKPVYSHIGKPYLPRRYFSDSMTTFYASLPQTPRGKKELGLEEKTAADSCREMLLNIK